MVIAVRVLLAFPPVPPVLALGEMRSRPPLGVYVLAGALRARGIDVRVADPSHLEAFLFSAPTSASAGAGAGAEAQAGAQADAAAVDAGLAALLGGVDVLGVSCHTFNWGVGRLLVERARRLFPGLVIVLGGLHPSLFPGHALEVAPADFVVAGEGERALPLLIAALAAGTLKPGAPQVVPPGGLAGAERLAGAELAAVEPAYDLVPRHYPSVSVESSRGCRHACTFCSVPHHGSWRALPPGVVAARVAAAFAALGRDARGGEVFIVDDCFTADPARALVILNAIGALGARAIMEGRIDDALAPGFLDGVPWDAVKSLQFGVECGYDEGLRRIGKGITIAAVEAALERVAAAGAAGRVVVSFIAGFPWESEAQWTRTIHCAADLACRYEVRVSTNVFGLYPSWLWDHRERFGIAAGEEVFDDPYWMLDQDVFFRLHPNLDPGAYGRIHALLQAYGQSGVTMVNAR